MRLFNHVILQALHQQHIVHGTAVHMWPIQQPPWRCSCWAADCQFHSGMVATHSRHGIHVLQVYRTIASSAAVKQKVNLLAYFESLCSDTSAANVLINSSLTVLFVRMLRNGKLPLLRIRLASVLGLLIRHATFIADELAGTNLVQILTEALSDINERVRRRCAGVLYAMHHAVVKRHACCCQATCIL